MFVALPLMLRLPPLLAQALHESLTFGLVKPSGMFISEKIKQVVPPLLVPGIARSLSRGLPHVRRLGLPLWGGLAG